jgi:hypothetical protein
VLRWTYLAAGILLLGLISFVVTSPAGAAVGLLCAVVVGGVSVLFVRLIDSYSNRALGEVAAMAMGGLVLGLVALLKWLTELPVGWVDAVGVLVSMGAAWGLETLLGGVKQQNCFVCHHSVQGGSFVCPRCKQIICTQPECWVAPLFRCQRCEELEVIILPIDERWWRNQLGPRVSNEPCWKCKREPHEADVRKCRKCGWPMCTRCWDYYNGQCARAQCKWVLPGLPAALTPFLGESRTAPHGATQPTWRHS